MSPLFQYVYKVETSRVNYEVFTKKDLVTSILDCKSQAMIGSPSEKYFKELVSEIFTALKSIPVTCTDITNAHTIFGTDLSGVWGGGVRQNPERVETEEPMYYVPRYFYGLHQFVTLTTDVVFVNGVPFLVTLSQKIRLFTVELIPSRTYVQLIS